MFDYFPDEADPWCYRWIGFTGECVDTLLYQISVSPAHPIVSVAARQKVRTLFQDILQTLQQAKPNSGMRSIGLLWVLLSEFMDETSSSSSKDTPDEHEIVKQVKQSIHFSSMHYTGKVSIEQIAKNLDYHRSHLSTVFKKYTGMSPIHYCIKIRMEHAVQLMAKPLMIKQIAASVGFFDSLYFSKQFKKYYGISPSKYRESVDATLPINQSVNTKMISERP